MSKFTVSLFGFGALLIGASLIFRWSNSESLSITNQSDIISEQLRKVGKIQSFYPNSRLLSIYVFNITNIQDMKDGGKPLLEEVGPYVYEMKSFKADTKFDETKDSIIYREPVFYYFRSDLKNGSLTDKINTISIPYILITSQGVKRGGVLRHTLRKLLMSSHSEAEPFVTETVDELLFGGKYFDYAETMAGQKGSEFYKNHTFGIYSSKNGTDNGLMEVSTGFSDPSETGRILSWNNSSKLSFWGENEYCNLINGSDGTLFPPHLKKDTIQHIFRPSLCRSLPLVYERDEKILGVPGYRYSLSKSFVEDPSVNGVSEWGQCFCTSRDKDVNRCPKTGAYQMESCRKGVPILASLPHFLDGAEEYREVALGLNPQREKHETFFTIAESGIVLESHVRFQMNVELKSTRWFPKLNNVRNMTFPILWIDESNKISKRNPILPMLKPSKPHQPSNRMILLLIDVVGCLLILMGFAKIVHTEWRNKRHPDFKMFSMFSSNTQSMATIVTSIE